MWWERWNLPKITRDLVLFTAGLFLTIHEAVLRSGPERPALLAMYAGMMGLPAILQADAKRRENAEEEREKREAEAIKRAVQAERRTKE